MPHSNRIFLPLKSLLLDPFLCLWKYITYSKLQGCVLQKFLEKVNWFRTYERLPWKKEKPETTRITECHSSLLFSFQNQPFKVILESIYSKNFENIGWKHRRYTSISIEGYKSSYLLNVFLGIFKQHFLGISASDCFTSPVWCAIIFWIHIEVLFHIQFSST